MTGDAYRTPDERFEELPDFPWEPRYREWEGMRLAHLDEGEGEPIVLLHGEPTWSFLWRKVMPPLLEAGYRCIAPDLPGFGRSDKPTDVGWYTYERHTAAVASLLWIINSVYSIGYMRGNRERHQTRFYVCFAIALASTMGVAFDGNLITLFIF